MIVTALSPFGRGDTSASKAVAISVTVPLAYVAGKLFAATSETWRTTGTSPKLITVVVLLMTTLLSNVTSTNSCVPAGNVMPVGKANAMPSRPLPA